MDANHERHFSNEQLPAAGLPDYRTVVFESVDADFRRYRLLSALLFWTPLIAALTLAVALGLLPEGLGAVCGGVLLALTGLTMAHRWLDAPRRGWALRRHDLIAREGVLWRSVTVLPIARIQHVETIRGPLERRFELARLLVYTAGGAAADLVVLGLDGNAADSLRAHLVDQIRRRDAVGTADRGPPGGQGEAARRGAFAREGEAHDDAPAARPTALSRSDDDVDAP